MHAWTRTTYVYHPVVILLADHDKKETIRKTAKKEGNEKNRGEGHTRESSRERPMMMKRARRGVHVWTAAEWKERQQRTHPGTSKQRRKGGADEDIKRRRRPLRVRCRLTSLSTKHSPFLLYALKRAVGVKKSTIDTKGNRTRFLELVQRPPH